MPRKTRADNLGPTTHFAASMRPRPDAAENTPPEQAEGDPYPGFNEAAARCRGKPWRVPPAGRGLALLQ